MTGKEKCKEWREAAKVLLMKAVLLKEQAGQEFPVQFLVDFLNEFRPELEDTLGREHTRHLFGHVTIRRLLKELEAEGKIRMEKKPLRRHIQVRTV